MKEKKLKRKQSLKNKCLKRERKHCPRNLKKKAHFLFRGGEK